MCVWREDRERRAMSPERIESACSGCTRCDLGKGCGEVEGIRENERASIRQRMIVRPQGEVGYRTASAPFRPDRKLFSKLSSRY